MTIEQVVIGSVVVIFLAVIGWVSAQIYQHANELKHLSNNKISEERARKIIDDKNEPTAVHIGNIYKSISKIESSLDRRNND